MKSRIASIVAVVASALALPTLKAAEGPEAPSLQEILRRPNPQVVVFQPTSMGPGESLNLTHVRVGDGSVRPGSAVQLIVYSSVPDEAGNHEVLFQDFHALSKEGSPVLHFDSFRIEDQPALVEGRKGIIAVLIGLLLPANERPVKPNALPPNDIISAEITDGTRIGLLLPAVQKVRSAAARLR